ncbi:MAG: hypothetical protein RSB77_01130 [Bacilli bacterium]
MTQKGFEFRFAMYLILNGPNKIETIKYCLFALYKESNLELIDFEGFNEKELEIVDGILEYQKEYETKKMK